MARKTATTIWIAAVLIALTGGAQPDLRAHPAADPRFEALVALTETRMKEHGVPPRP